MNITELIGNIIEVIDETFVPLVFAIAFLIILWGTFQYFIAGAENEDKRKEGRMFVLYGILGLVIMVSVWGLVNVITETLGFGDENAPDIPKIGD